MVFNNLIITIYKTDVIKTSKETQLKFSYKL